MPIQYSVTVCRRRLRVFFSDSRVDVYATIDDDTCKARPRRTPSKGEMLGTLPSFRVSFHSPSAQTFVCVSFCCFEDLFPLAVVVLLFPRRCVVARKSWLHVGVPFGERGGGGGGFTPLSEFLCCSACILPCRLNFVHARLILLPSLGSGYRRSRGSERSRGTRALGNPDGGRAESSRQVCCCFAAVAAVAVAAAAACSAAVAVVCCQTVEVRSSQIGATSLSNPYPCCLRSTLVPA